MIKQLDKYVLKSYVGPLLATFFITSFVLLLQFLWLYVDDLTGKGLGFGVIAEFLFWALITLTPLSFPLSVLLSSIMTMGSLGESNELLAMKAAGISIQRTIRPMMVMAILISISAFFVANNLVPYSYLKISALLRDIRAKREEIRIPTDIFYNGIEGYSLRVGARNEKTNQIYQVLLYDHIGKKGNNIVTRADSGSIAFSADKKYIVFILYNGYTYEEEIKDLVAANDTTYPFQRRYFTRQEVLVSLDGYDFTRNDHDDLKESPQMKRLDKLAMESDSLKQIKELREHEFVHNIGASSGLTRPYDLDTSVAAQGKYVRCFAFDSVFNALSLDAKAHVVREAINNAQTGNTNIDVYSINYDQVAGPKRKLDIERNRKFTLAIACLFFFFIGAPLGAIIRKGGLGTPVVVSIFFFVLYWVIDITGRKLARDGVWDVGIAIWLSSIVLLPIGIFFTYSASKDSALFSAERYKLFGQKIIGLFTRKKKND